jgi:eukaryotic-like serine/threonine-protein kinase
VIPGNRAHDALHLRAREGCLGQPGPYLWFRMICLDENTLTEFLQGVLPADEKTRVEEHIDDCADCRALLSALSRLSLDSTIPRVTEPAEGSNSAAPEPGQLIAGKYRIERVIGAGGMGVVAAATHVELNQVVALKFMQPNVLGNAEAAARFLREARAVARLKSEHVGRVLDVGKLESGAPYIVMEYLEGEDLDHLVSSNGPLPVDQAAHYVLQALEAVAEAHAAGIVHRDLKPANLFLTLATGGAQSVKVLDFGVSKYSEPNAMDLDKTDARAVIGSPLYMAPEQLVSAGTVDRRADIWSLGCTLYQLVSGATPFEGSSLPQLTANILRASLKPLSNLRSEIPAGFARVVDRCLAKDPAARFPDVVELADALAPFAPPAARDLVARVGAILGVGLGIAIGEDGTTRKSLRRISRRQALVASGLGLATLAAVLAFFASHPRPEAKETPLPERRARVVASPVLQPAPSAKEREPSSPSSAKTAPASVAVRVLDVQEPPRNGAKERLHGERHSSRRSSSKAVSAGPAPVASDDVFSKRK